MIEELQQIVKSACDLIPAPIVEEVSWRRCCTADLPKPEELAFEVLTKTGLIHKSGAILAISGEVDNSYDFEYNPDLTMPKFTFKVTYVLTS